jgi:hypothetical protein
MKKECIAFANWLLYQKNGKLPIEKLWSIYEKEVLIESGGEYESIINEIADAKALLNRAEVALANILDRHEN